MHSMKLVSAIAVLLAMSATCVEAAVRVNFVNPERYHDEDFRSFKRDGIIAEFQKEFDRLGSLFIRKGRRSTSRCSISNWPDTTSLGGQDSMR